MPKSFFPRYSPLTAAHFAAQDLGAEEEEALAVLKLAFERAALFSPKPNGRPKTPQPKPTLTWHPAGQTLAVNDLTITAGLFYSSNGSPHLQTEPSVVNLNLKVAEGGDKSGQHIYQAKYSDLTPGQRRSYLEWLAAGRQDAKPEKRPSHHITLALHGIERRLLADGDTDPALLEEALRLFKHYGKESSYWPGSRIFSMLHFCGWKLGPAAYRALWPRAMQQKNYAPDGDALRLILANLHALAEPLAGDIAWHVAQRNQDCRRGSVLSRAPEKVRELFRLRYRKKLPSGILLRATKQPAVIHYRPDNPSMNHWSLPSSTAVSLEARVPNVLGIHRQLKQFDPLVEIWNSCIQDLATYSRIRTSLKTGLSLEVALWEALPPELQALEPHPLAAALPDILAALPQEADGFWLVPAGAIAALLNIAPRDKLNTQQTARMEVTLERAGWFMAPSPRQLNASFLWGQETALYARTAGEVYAEEVPRLLRMLCLAMALATADGGTGEVQMAAFHRLIAAEALTEEDRRHLHMTEAVLRRDPALPARLLSQAARQVEVGQQKEMFRDLARIAAADGGIGPGMVKMLRQIARAFLLAANELETLVKKDPALREVTVIWSAKDRAWQESGRHFSSAADGSKPAGPLELDMGRVHELKVESHEVITLLSRVMAEGEEAEEASPVENGAAPAAETPAWLDGLEGRFHAAMVQLVKQDEMSLEDFDQLAADHHLMPDDLLHTVNAWADETLGDFLLERGKTIQMYRDLLSANGCG